MRDSTSHNDNEGRDEPQGNESITPPHPEDLRSVMLGREPSQPTDFEPGVFSDEGKSDSEPDWSEVSSGTSNQPDDPPWTNLGQGRDDYDVGPTYERQSNQPPFDTDAYAEADERHPPAVARFGPPAGFGRRLIAYLIDNMVTILILSLLFPIILGRPYIDYEGIVEEIDIASNQIDALPTATPVLGSQDGEATNTGLSTTSQSDLSLAELFAGLFLAFAVTTVYNTVLIGLWGTTIGKRALNVYVLDGNGNITGIPLAFSRALSTIVSTVIFYIGYLLILRYDHRALHDLMAGTYAITLVSSERPTQRPTQRED